MEYAPGEIRQRIEDTSTVTSKETCLSYAALTLPALVVFFMVVAKRARRRKQKKTKG